MTICNNTIICDKCGGKGFVDLTFTDNRNYEVFCIICGKRDFVGRDHTLYDTIKEYVRSVLVA